MPTTTERLTVVVGDASSPLPLEVADGLDLLVLDTTAATHDPLEAWVLDGILRLFAEFTERLVPPRSAEQPIVVLFLDAEDPALSPVLEAAFAAVQAVALSLALEYPQTHITVLRALAGNADAVAATLSFLGRVGGGYITAATIDLRSAA